jgi:hypothetical protein
MRLTATRPRKCLLALLDLAPSRTGAHPRMFPLFTRSLRKRVNRSKIAASEEAALTTEDRTKLLRLRKDERTHASSGDRREEPPRAWPGTGETG